MHAIVISPGTIDDSSPIGERYPTPLLWTVDRPFIQHIIESLAKQGVTSFDIVLSYLPQKLEKFLGNGERWGCTFQYHLAKEIERPYGALRNIHLKDGEKLLLLHADRLPEMDLHREIAACENSASVVFCCDDNSLNSSLAATTWTGWALVRRDLLTAAPNHASENELFNYLIGAGGSSMKNVRRCLSVRSYENLLNANVLPIEKKFRGLTFSGNEIEDGIWLSRNVVMHPTVKLTPPVYICEDARIERGCQLGPNAVIGNHCVIDSKSKIKDSVVFPGSYVGCGLEVERSVVDKNCLVNLAIGASLVVADEFVLANLHEKKLHAFLMRTASRLMGMIGFAAALPFIAATACFLRIFRRRVFFWKEAIHLPASLDRNQWKTIRLLSFSPQSQACVLKDFFLRVLPGLYNVARGDLSFVGVSPRNADEIETLDSDWKHLYLESKAGLITESFVVFGANATEDDCYSAETFYSVTAGFKYDLSLLWRYALLTVRFRNR